MCTEVWRGDEVADTVSGLRVMLGVSLVFPDGYEPSSDNECLCGCDVPATLDANGLAWQSTPFGYEIKEQKGAGR